MEGASTTVYAQGGRGNARLIAWDGERTVTFTMEDALISTESLSILASAKLISLEEGKHHVSETIDASASVGKVTIVGETELTVELSETPYLADTTKNLAYVMLVKDGEIISEPYIVQSATGKQITVTTGTNKEAPADSNTYTVVDEFVAGEFDSVIVDYYTLKAVKEIQITPDMLGGNFYLEAETLFRNEKGEDLPAVFTIPNCKVQSNFTFTMAASGDPSTFTFTMDAFPDYTYFDKSQKVFADIQVIEDINDGVAYRTSTNQGD